GLWIDAVALGQGPQALLTTLYRSTDCLCRRGAAMKNLAQSASLHAGENNAPSKLGTKQATPCKHERLDPSLDPVTYFAPLNPPQNQRAGQSPAAFPEPVRALTSALASSNRCATSMLLAKISYKNSTR